MLSKPTHFSSPQLPASDVAMLSESMKASNLTKSQLTSCNVCNMAAPRKTRVRERLCRDKA
ncbi:hypothetical protein PC120_g21926 [Phytophthora cactorum]|nr:hypothetical protein PC120_g21926 [Phytophthora cactorum]